MLSKLKERLNQQGVGDLAERGTRAGLGRRLHLICKSPKHSVSSILAVFRNLEPFTLLKLRNKAICPAGGKTARGVSRHLGTDTKLDFRSDPNAVQAEEGSAELRRGSFEAATQWRGRHVLLHIARQPG